MHLNVVSLFGLAGAFDVGRQVVDLQAGGGGQVDERQRCCKEDWEELHCCFSPEVIGRYNGGIGEVVRRTRVTYVLDNRRYLEMEYAEARGYCVGCWRHRSTLETLAVMNDLGMRSGSSVISPQLPGTILHLTSTPFSNHSHDIYAHMLAARSMKQDFLVDLLRRSTYEVFNCRHSLLRNSLLDEDAFDNSLASITPFLIPPLRTQVPYRSN